ncbi:unnamed protein product [Camellia sinensis]
MSHQLSQATKQQVVARAKESEQWKGCAGQLVSVPRNGERAQGLIEQARKDATQVVANLQRQEDQSQ